MVSILEEVKAPYIIASYYYLRGKNPEAFFKRVKGFKKQLILDSGAHTFLVQEGAPTQEKVFTSKKSYGKGVKIDIDKYFEDYLDFVMKFKRYIEAYVELDIDQVEGVGLEKVKEWREVFAKKGLIKLMPVYHHKNMVMKDWDEMCRNYKWVALESGSSLGSVLPYFDIAKKYQTKVHGFAMTKYESARRFPYYSGDSTAWLTGGKYGQTFVFKARKIQTVEKGERRRLFKFATDNNLNFQKILADDWREVNKLNALAWIKFGEELIRVEKRYWNREWKDCKGMIAKIREDPAIEKKRIIRLKEISKGNTFHWINGKQSKYHPTPDYLHRHLQFLDGINLSDRNLAKKAIHRLIISNLKRITLNEWFEIADGGVQDKQLSKLIKDTVDMIMDASGIRPQTPSLAQQFNIDFSGISKMSEKERKALVKGLEVE